MLLQLEKVFSDADIECSISELHGTMCGILIGSTDCSFEKWMQEMINFNVSETAFSHNQLRLLRNMFADLSTTLMTGDLNFRILLLANETAYAKRVHALSEWCSGFVYGVVANRAVQIPKLSTHNQVFISTASDLTLGVSSETNENSSEDESAYAKMVEYLSVGVLSLSDEVQQSLAAAVENADGA